MLALEIFVNGGKLYTIAATDPGSIGVSISRERKRGSDQAEVKVGAMGANLLPEGITEILEWADCPLSVGDEVIVRLVETGEIGIADEPQRRFTIDAEGRDRHRREYYERLNTEYGE